jgi:hypothetical protein
LYWGKHPGEKKQKSTSYCEGAVERKVKHYVEKEDSSSYGSGDDHRYVRIDSVCGGGFSGATAGYSGRGSAATADGTAGPSG